MVLFGLSWDPKSIEDESEISKSEARETIASVVKVLREELGLTQAKLARRSGLDTRHIGKIENGDDNPTFHTLLRIVSGFCIDWEKLGRVVDRHIASRTKKRKGA